MRTLTLVVPHLSRLLAATRSARLPILRRFVSRSSFRFYDGIGLAAWYCQRFDIAPARDWPIAALLAAGTGIDDSKYWICADPANLAVDRDRVIMMATPPLSDTESAELFESVRNHISGDRLRLLRVDAMHWCIGCEDAQELSGTEPSLCAGRNIDELLLRGSDAPRWLRLGTELQMLLHEHPVNLARESRGEAPVNSLWFWGGGELPRIPSSKLTVAAQESLPRALAGLSKATVIPLSVGLAATLADQTEGDLIAVADDASAGASTGDTESSAHAWEQSWIAPAWQALKANLFDRAVLAGMHGDGMIELSVDRAARWKFWRRGNPVLQSIDPVS